MVDCLGGALGHTQHILCLLVSMANCFTAMEECKEQLECCYHVG